MPDTVLQTCSLAMTRGEQRIVLPDIHLSKGEALALSGPSGSGKTSLLLALAGLVRPETGEVLVEGQSLWAMSEAVRAKMRGRAIGFLFADFRLIDAMSVMDNLQIARASAHLALDFDRAHTLLERLQIADLAERRADSLSQGQMQRVAMARALMNTPKVLLADEPTAALDRDNGDRLINLLLDLARDEGATLILATHDPSLVRRLGKVAFVSSTHNGVEA